MDANAPIIEEFFLKLVWMYRYKTNFQDQQILRPLWLTTRKTCLFNQKGFVAPFWWENRC